MKLTPRRRAMRTSSSCNGSDGWLVVVSGGHVFYVDVYIYIYIYIYR
jgi:hypothetical protein